MEGKSYKVKKSGQKPTQNKGKKEDVQFPPFCDGGIPDHHFSIVKDWFINLSECMIEFSESMVKKLKCEKNAEVFVSDTFCINNINDSLINLLIILDSSVQELLVFRSEMCNYIATSQVPMKDPLPSESGLPIQKPSEVNRLTLEDISNERSSVDVNNCEDRGNNHEKTNDVENKEVRSDNEVWTVENRGLISPVLESQSVPQDKKSTINWDTSSDSQLSKSVWLGKKKNNDSKDVIVKNKVLKKIC